MKIGQINYERGGLGQHLVNLVRQDEINTVVEVGSWNGMGSTRCVVEGLKNKKNYLFKSYECCFGRYNEALNNNRGKISDKFQIIFGKLVEEDDITGWFDIEELSEEQKTWLKQDLDWMRNAPNVLYTVPVKIDLLILDGGEFSTYNEWKILESRTKYVILDDTKCLKAKKIRQEIIDRKITVMVDCLSERNGYLIGKLR